MKQSHRNSNFLKFSLRYFCCSFGRNLGSLLFLLVSLFLNFANISRNEWEFSSEGSKNVIINLLDKLKMKIWHIFQKISRSREKFGIRKWLISSQINYLIIPRWRKSTYKLRGSGGGALGKFFQCHFLQKVSAPIPRWKKKTL